MEPMIKTVDQVALVVKDAKAVVRFFTEVLGVGPFRAVQFGDSGQGVRYGTIENCVCEGELIGTYSIDCCCCWQMPNGVELEVIGPLTGSSIFARYLQRHGAGVQHISIVQDDYDASIARMEAAGCKEGQRAIVAEEETCSFVDHMSVLGTYVELHKRPPVMKPLEGLIDVEFFPGPDPDVKPVKPALFDQIEKITAVTEDIDASIAVLEGAYGLGPWERSKTQAAEIAICDTLNLCIQLETPLSPESAGYHLLKENGTDIRSITVRQINDVPEGIAVTKVNGVDCIDLTDTLGTVIELRRA